MIENSVIDEIIEVSRCEEVIQDFISLKKSGANWVGLSPFTNEKTPSFTVSATKNIWKDFSSGKGGNAIAFLMQAQKMSFPESLKYLAEKYNIDLKIKKQTFYDLENISNKKECYAALNYSKDYYYNNLKKTKLVQTYLIDRGFTPAIVKKFKLGYSLDSWNDFLNNAIANNYLSDVLEKVDLVFTKDRRTTFDKFRNRLMFPIFDVQSRVIGYGARILIDDKKEAKYLNSRETEFYKKSSVLYGLNFAVSEIVKQDICYVTEGYTDVISFHQKEVCNTVASCGTALTEDQLKIIKRYTHNVCFVFDGDRAGIKATFKAIDLALALDFNVQIIKLIDVDPDEFAKTTDNLSDYLYYNALDFVDYKASFIDDLKIDEKSKIINHIIKSISFISDSIKKELYTSKVSSLFQLKPKQVLIEVENEKKLFKQSYIKRKVNRNSFAFSLNEIAESNPELSIQGISVCNYIIYKIQQLEEPEVPDLEIDFNSVSLFHDQDLEIIIKQQIDDIFKSIKFEFINLKINSVTNENLNFVQDLIFIKQKL